jgi:hypothetical protein
VHIAEHTRTYEFVASEREVIDYLSRRVLSGKALVSLTSLKVSLLMKIISPFQEV